MLCKLSSMAAMKLNLTEVQTVLSAVQWNIRQWLSLLYHYISHNFWKFVLLFYMMLCYDIKLHVFIFLFFIFDTGVYTTHDLEKKKSNKIRDKNRRICSEHCISNLCSYKMPWKNMPPFSGERTGKRIREGNSWFTVVKYIPQTLKDITLFLSPATF